MGLYDSKDKIYQNQNKKGLNSCMRYAAEKKEKKKDFSLLQYKQ